MTAANLSPLRKAREARDLSLKEVAAAVGTFTGNLSRIERGLHNASRDLAAALAKFFAPDITELHIFYPERYADFCPSKSSAYTKKAEILS
ncbi:helix-turn-helix domain-containing protein [Pararobbsia silviterrae]|uniref:XRE family transcriptional regulator n=1 Tax=Pararobbsia silviterrae TaxID=1792498 RepID=A0A494X2Y4_9BURK|nr:helix-turn-helix transcriptional regulator [Pararobbsia silviterrae]RKP44710.1 XRE family transcriptional regulator [Pararobbsia silviterrae]